MLDPDGQLDDATLVERAREGDAPAFEVLVRRHFRAAYAVALAQLGNAMDAEDVCQDAFLRALKRLDDCRHPDRFSGWLLRIVRNRAHNYRDYRRVRDGLPLERSNASEPARGPEALRRSRLRSRLESALACLTPIQREVVLLYDLEGWRHREIAETLEISEVMSRQHLYVARRKLRRELGEEALEEYSDDG